MKALILCAGSGTRLRPFTHLLPKSLMPVGNRPLVTYLIDQLIAANIREIGIVVPPRHEEFLDLSRVWFPEKAVFEWIVQHQPLGLAHAVLQAKFYLKGEPFLLLLGDNYTQLDVRQMMRKFRMHPDAEGLVALKRVRDPWNFGVAEVAGERIQRLTEKPPKPASNLIAAGVYLLSPAIFQVIERLEPSLRGELEITDALQEMVQQGRPIYGWEYKGFWQDVGSATGLLKANKFMLQRIRNRIDGTIQGCSVVGPVWVGEGARIIRSKLQGPLIIGKDCLVDGAQLGPYLTVGDDCTIRRAHLRESLLMSGSCIQDWQKPVVRSILGRNSFIKGSASSGRMLLADDSSIWS